MFESLNRENRKHPLQSPSSFLVSLCIHGTILGVIVALPLIFGSVLEPGESVFSSWTLPGRRSCRRFPRRRQPGAHRAGKRRPTAPSIMRPRPFPERFCAGPWSPRARGDRLRSDGSAA